MKLSRMNKKFAIYISLAIVAVLVAFLFVYPYFQNITIVADKEIYITSTLGLLTATLTITSPLDDEIAVVPLYEPEKLTGIERMEIYENGKWRELSVSESPAFNNWEKVSLDAEGFTRAYSEPIKVESKKPVQVKLRFDTADVPTKGEFHAVVFSRSEKTAQISLKYEIREPLLKERAWDYEVFDNHDGSFTYRTGGVPLWTYDQQTKAYKSFVNRLLDGTREIRNGMVGVIFDEETVQFFDTNGTESRISDEDWILLRDGQEVATNLTGTDTVENNTHIVHTRYYSSEAGRSNISYIFGEGVPLKHNLRFSASQQGTYQLVQKWKGIDFDETIEQDAIEGIKIHDHKLGEKKIKKTKPDNLPEDLEFRKDGKLVIHEVTSSAMNEFEEFEVDSELKQVKFVWGRWNLEDGESFVLDPDTFSSNNPTEDAILRDNGNNDVCDGDSLGARIGSDIFMASYETSLSVDCDRSFVEWDITSITDGSDVTNTVFKFEVYEVSSPRNCDYMEINNQPSTAADSTLWTDIGDGTVFVDADSTCTTTGTNKQIDLGTSADSDVEAQLSSNWWAVGLKEDSESLDSTRHISKINPEEAASTPDPTLEITYTLPNTVPRFADNNTYQNTTRSATNTYTYSSSLNISASINITDTDGDAQLETVIIQVNGTNITNKKTTDSSFLGSGLRIYNKSLGGQYYVNFTSLAAGTYVALWWVNDSSNGQNQSTNFTITINRAGTLSKMFLNDSQTNVTYERGVAANFTATVNISGKTANIDTNITGWNVQSGTDFVTNVSTLSSTGKFNITGYFVADANYTGSSETFYATVSDTITPTITVQQPTNTTFTTSTVWANITLNEAGSWCGRSLDGGSNTTMTNSSGNWNNQMTSLSQTPHSVRVYCNDTTGNMAASSTIFFTVDTIPTITADSPTNTTYTTGSIWANATISEAASVVLRSLDSGANVSLTNSSGNWNNQMTSLSQGPHGVTIYANDTNGNDASPVTVFFTVDLPASPYANCYNQTNISSFYICSYDNSEFPAFKSAAIIYSGKADRFSSLCNDVVGDSYKFNLTAIGQLQTVIPFTNGVCANIGNKTGVIERQGAPSTPFNSSFELRGPTNLQLRLQYEKIRIAGDGRFPEGNYRICAKKIGQEGSTVIVNVTAC